MIITHADGCHVSKVFTFRCQSVFPHDIAKTDEARITKLDIETFLDDLWKPFIWGSKGEGREAQNSTGVRFRTFLSADLFSQD